MCSIKPNSVIGNVVNQCEAHFSDASSTDLLSDSGSDFDRFLQPLLHALDIACVCQSWDSSDHTSIHRSTHWHQKVATACFSGFQILDDVENISSAVRQGLVIANPPNLAGNEKSTLSGLLGGALSLRVGISFIRSASSKGWSS